MGNSVTIRWADGRGRDVVREINQVIDVRAFIGTPGYSSLIVAANTHLSVSDIEIFLHLQSRETPGVARSRSWIQRRRWLYQQPNARNSSGSKPNQDGKDARAVAIMGDNPTMSVRQLVRELKERGINRGREWVRMHRCDAGV